LKEIDIICYDKTSSIKRNYEEFIVFENMRFQNKKTEDYLQFLKKEMPYHSNIRSNDSYDFSLYEQEHDYFMNNE
jgi:hypothetical protein